MLFIIIFDFLEVNLSARLDTQGQVNVRTCAAGFDFQEEGDQSILVGSNGKK